MVGFESVAPTLAYDAAAFGDDRVVPTGRAANVTAPSLVMDGGDSRDKMPFMFASAEELAAVLPHVERCTLEGQHDRRHQRSCAGTRGVRRRWTLTSG